tara:strand:+ start:702 stop:2408 length:1707 start_codon:yes stop_codon:yes gene_type:complete
LIQTNLIPFEILMLKYLSIKNIILIDKLEIDFKQGLCVLTGETGAGKSIILNSLGLAIGYRANYSYRQENDKITEIIAGFSVKDDPEINHLLESFGLDENYENEIILKRQLLRDNKSKAFINEQVVSLNTLKMVGSHLIEIQSQFSEQGLLDSSTHINVLDKYGNLEPYICQVQKQWEILKKFKEKLNLLILEYEKVKNNKEIFDYEFKELKEFSPTKEEYDDLLNRKKNLLNSTKIKENLNIVLKNFSSDEGNGIEEKISKNINLLEQIKDFSDSDIKSSSKSLEETLINIQELNANISNYLEKFEDNSFNLEEIEERIYNYRRLSKKHKCSEADLSDKLKSLNLSHLSYDDMEQKIKSEKLNLESIEKEYFESCIELSKQRKLYACDVDNKINAELPSLKLESSKFKTLISESEKPGRNGKDLVKFFVKTNDQSKFDEIKSISSGGELCRFALAIKVVTSKKSSTAIVFDEVDSGIGGAVASAVGERLRKLGNQQQVLVVTHSPQVASLGNDHFKISKKNDNTKTTTSIKRLEGNDRVQEIARMLSGKEITLEAEAAARKLIENIT